jgi:hypothetical protein
MYSDDIVYLHPSISAYSHPPRTINPESRYRRALAEYLAAEEELLRARQEATLRARAEALGRQEEARLLQARTIHARGELQAQRLKQLLAQQRAAVLAAKTAIPEVHLSLPHRVPVACSIPERREKPIPSVFTPKTHISFMGEDQLFKSMPINEEVCRMYNLSVDSPDTPTQRRPEHRSAPHLVPENGTSASTLESLLQARLRKVASHHGDEEVQALARATLHHLVQHTSGRNVRSAHSSEVGIRRAFSSISQSLTSCLQTEPDSVTPTPGTDLSRSDALQGAVAEAAKASFKAHRAPVAEQAAPPASKTAPSGASSPLEAIQDIQAIFSKLSADFSIPPSLDLSDDEADGLAYTPTNAPIRAYEHALEGLLAQLDAVESDGDEEVRVARRSVVKEVETALEVVETKVKSARELAQDNSEPGENFLPGETTSSTDLVEEEDAHTHPESDAGIKTEEEEDSASISSHTPPASYSSLAPVPAPEVDAAAFAADFFDLAPDNSATEDTSAEETTKIVSEPTSSTSAATVQDKVARIYTVGVPESRYNALAEQLIPAHETSVPPTLETREEVVSVSHEDFILTSTPVSPEFPSPALPEDVSASNMPALPVPEGEVAGPDDSEEDEWSEVEA